MYYFGCKSKDKKGHHLYDKNFSNWFANYDAWWSRVVKLGIDGDYAPKSTRQAGYALLHHVDGMTFLSFWDYSADSRMGSNSNFIRIGTHTFDEMLTEAKETFPSLFERFNFEVRELKDDRTEEKHR